MSLRLSMSRLGLAHSCSYGFRSDVDAEPGEAGRAAKRGSVVHALAEAKVNGTSTCEEVDPTILAEAKEIYDGPLAGFIEGHKWTFCERGLRYDAESDTAADGPRRGEPGYDSVPEMTLPGTTDLVRIQGDWALVVDIKTGKPPTDSEQLYGQAVAVSRRFGVSRVRVQYARALKTKLDLLNTEDLDADRLDAEAGRIRRLLRLVPESKPRRDNKWCWRCDARAVCPEWRNDDYGRAHGEPAVYDEYMSLF